MLPSWLRRLYANKFPARATGRNIPYRRTLNLETLEERDAPAVRVWTGVLVPSGNPNWSGTGNWVGGQMPANGDDVIFPVLNAENKISSVIDYSVTLANLTIQDSGYNITGQTTRVFGTITASQTTGSSSLGFNIPLTSNPQGINVTSATASLGIGGILSEAPGLPNGAGLLKGGAGTLSLSGNNTFTKLVEVSQGTLVAASNTALGTTDVGTVVRDGATLSVSAANVGESVELIGTGVGSQGALIASGSTVWTGGVALNPSASIGGGGTIEVTGIISGGGNLTKVGSGTLILSAANTYTGQTLINGGVVQLRHDLGLSPGSTTTVGTGATLQLFGSRVVDEPLFLNGNGVPDLASVPTGALNVVNSAVLATANWVGTVTLQSNASIGAALNATLIITGQLSGAPNLTKVGQGTLILPNANINFQGNTLINDGTLIMRDAQALGPRTAGGGSNPGGSITVNNGGTLQVEKSYTVEKDLTLNGLGFNSGGALRIIDEPTDGVATNIVWANGITLGSATSITVDATSQLLITGIISGAAGVTLERTGAGVLILSSANTYLGATTLRQGLTLIQNSQALGGAGGAGTSISSGATLSLRDGLTVPGEGLTLSGLGFMGQGAIRAGAGTNEWTGSVNLIGTQADINVANAAGTLTFSNVLSGDAIMRKIGAGELRLTGSLANTFSGTAQVDAGTLALGKTAGVNALAGPVIIGDGIGGNNADVLRLDAANQIPDAQPVRVNASGLFNLNNNSETINALTLQAGEVATGTGILTLGGNVTTLAGPGMTDPTAVIAGNLSLGGSTRTFTVADDTASMIDLLVTAVISGGAGVGINKAGAGQMTLSALNTYGGATTVNAGTLRLGSNNVLPDDTAVTIDPGSTLNVNGQTDAVGSLAGGGTLALGTGVFTTGGNNASTTFSGVITGTGGLTKVGTGALVLSGNSPAYTGTTTVAGGTLLVNGNQGGAAVVVQSGATLGGTGTVGAVTVNAGGMVAPGVGPGRLSTNGNVTFAAGSSFVVEVNGTTAGTQYDQLAVTGSVNLGNANLTFIPGFTPAIGNSFTIITTTGGVTGTFNGLSDLATFTINNRVYQIDYTATSVVVTMIALAANATLTSNLNPSSPGQSVTFTFTVQPLSGTDPTPTGTVEFFDGMTSLGTRTLGAGMATLTTSMLPLGTRNIFVVYSGDANYTGRTIVLTPAQVVNVVTTTDLQTSGPVTFGSAVAFTATVTPATPGPVPTGTVTFVNATTGATLGVVALNASGTATLVTTAAPAGTNTILAVYSGDATYRTSSDIATQVVFRIERYAVGTGAGTLSAVRLYDPRTGALLGTLDPFPGYRGGVRVAVGDVNNDGTSDIIVAAGPGAPGGHIKIFSGVNGTLLASYFSFPGFAGGVNLASGDVNGDGFEDVIVSTAAVTDHVKVFSGGSQGLLMSFFAYGGGNPVGVTVGAGDINGDGRADVITGTAARAGHVKVFGGVSGQLLRSFLAYGSGFAGGVNVAGGDLNGDGLAEIITGAETVAPHVKAFDGATHAVYASFIAYPGAPPIGVRVGAVDRDGNGIADILTGAGGAAPHVKIFSGLTLGLLDSFISTTPGLQDSPTGIFVGGGG